MIDMARVRQELPTLSRKHAELRQFFPALNRPREDRLPIFLDGPGGTQVPEQVMDSMVEYLRTCNANHGGAFATSRESDQIVAAAHQAMADLLHAPAPEEIIFGANMTTLTFHFTRAVSRILRPGDEIVVTRMDHDANVSPWVLAARDAGAVVRFADVHPEDCTLDLEGLRKLLNSRTRWLALACASNAVGTINDVHTIVRWAHDAGARIFLDAVHYAPHGPIDVQEWDCDALACSAYKFFGPHVGVLWARRSLLEELPAYRVRPAPDTLPDRWMTGTQNHEGLAGVVAAVNYLAGLPQTPAATDWFRGMAPRARDLHAGMVVLQQYEATLAERLLEALADRPRFKVWGITDRRRLAERVPTISITMEGRTVAEIAEHLAARQIYAWHGNMYALELTERLRLEERGGFLRLGLVHYNTAEEIDGLIQALDAF